jgi:hypothetical protein
LSNDQLSLEANFQYYCGRTRKLLIGWVMQDDKINKQETDNSYHTFNIFKLCKCSNIPIGRLEILLWDN